MLKTHNRKIVQATIGIMLGNIIYGAYFVLIKLSIAHVSPFVFLWWVTFIATGVLSLIVLSNKKYRKELKLTEHYKAYFMISMFIMVLPLNIIAYGMQFTSSVNTAILSLSELFFIYVISHIFIKKNNLKTTLGSILVLVGSIIVMYEGKFQFQTGDILILIGTACFPIGNIFAKKVLAKMSSATVLFARFVIALPFLFAFAYFGNSGNLMISDSQVWIYILICAILVYVVAKFIWYQALKVIDLVTATALGATFPIFTILFSFLLEGISPSLSQISGLIAGFIGVYFIYKGELLNYKTAMEL